jgi:hypothetical protein
MKITNKLHEKCGCDEFCLKVIDCQIWSAKYAFNIIFGEKIEIIF